MKKRVGHRIVLVVAVVGLVLSMGAVGWWQGAVFPVPAIPLLGIAFTLYAVAAWSASASERLSPWMLWGVAIVLRLLFLPLEPILSDDIYRYLWDGHVQTHGINPYLYAPSDPALESIQTPWHSLINNPDISTIYPPVAQLLFLGVALVGTSVLKMKLVMVGLELAAGALLVRYAERTGRSANRVGVLYLWSPLLVVEVAWSGHLEGLGLAAIALLLTLQRHPIRSGLALTAAALTKFAPLAAIPPLTRRLGVRLPLVVGLCASILYLPYLSAGSQLWAGLLTFAEHWRANEGLFLVVESFFGEDPMPPRRAAGAIVVAVVGWVTLRRYSVERSLFWIFGAGLLLSPTVHPWYVLWVLPFAALRRSYGFLLLTGLIFLGYWGLGSYQRTNFWVEPLWARFLLWIPVWFVIGLEAMELRHRPPTRAEPEAG